LEITFELIPPFGAYSPLKYLKGQSNEKRITKEYFGFL
jgi:hypothetical protein